MKRVDEKRKLLSSAAAAAGGEHLHLLSVPDCDVGRTRGRRAEQNLVVPPLCFTMFFQKKTEEEKNPLGKPGTSRLLQQNTGSKKKERKEEQGGEAWAFPSTRLHFKAELDRNVELRH